MTCKRILYLAGVQRLRPARSQQCDWQRLTASAAMMPASVLCPAWSARVYSHLMQHTLERRPGEGQSTVLSFTQLTSVFSSRRSWQTERPSRISVELAV